MFQTSLKNVVCRAATCVSEGLLNITLQVTTFLAASSSLQLVVSLQAGTISLSALYIYSYVYALETDLI